MIRPKTETELSAMAQGGSLLGIILSDLLKMVRPGIRLSDIEKVAQEKISQAGGKPSFMTVKGYSWATCICINEEVVHGIPTGYRIADGDLVTIDIGMVYSGFHTDTASSVIAGAKLSGENDKILFLEAGKKALSEAISQAVPGARVYDISRRMEEVITSCGYDPVKSLVGHGVGRELHEPPQIPCFTKGDRNRSQKLENGMTLAIEVIYAQNRGDVVYGNDDGWTISTRDGSLSAVFEHTISVGEKPAILTLRPEEKLADKNWG